MKQDDSIGQRLRKLRIAHKLTQEKMANTFFITRSSIANYERGTRQPSFDLLQHIADYFKIDILYLLGSSENSAECDLSKDIVSAARFLTKDAMLDISSLSALHKIMAIEYVNFLRMTEETEKMSNCNN